MVEDEPVIRRFLAEGLTDAGFHIITAHNGAVALDRAEEHQPDAVVLDLLMPVMDGLEFLRERQQQPRLAAVPVVVLSAGGLKALRDAVALRATAALVKPVDLAVLSSVLEDVLREVHGKPADPTSIDKRQRQEVGRCPICGRTTFTRLERHLTRAERVAEIYRARRSHVMSHSAADLAHEPLRIRLLQLPLDRRRILADWMSLDLRHYWGDRDRRGVYSINEVLHLPALHHLWHDASSCGDPDCRHD